MTFNLSTQVSRLPNAYFRLVAGIKRRQSLSSGGSSRAGAGRTEAPKGQVFIVGAGPGEADLLTVKAYKLLQSADVVLFDWLVDESVLAIIPRSVRTEFVGKRSGRHSMPQQDICHRLVELAQQGLTVVRLKGGDPAVFARTCEETDALSQAGIPFAIVPGITAASGASAYTGIPLTDRRCARAVTLMTAHLQDPEEEPDWSHIHNGLKTQTLVLYMGLKRLGLITQRLTGAGVPLDLPVAVIENACCPNQFVITATLSDIADKVLAAELKGPALLIFGDVVAARQQVDPALLQQITHVTPV